MEGSGEKMASNYQRGIYKEYEKLQKAHDRLQYENNILMSENRVLTALIKEVERLKEQLAEKEKLKEELDKEVQRLNGLLNIDSTNSGIPTSKTPIGKKKKVPNSRQKTTRHVGGQYGHKKNKLEAFEEQEVTEIEEHVPTVCEKCGGEVERTSKSTDKDELDYEFVVIKRRHRFVTCTCKKCGKQTRLPIPNHL